MQYSNPGSSGFCLAPINGRESLPETSGFHLGHSLQSAGHSLSQFSSLRLRNSPSFADVVKSGNPTLDGGDHYPLTGANMVPIGPKRTFLPMDHHSSLRTRFQRISSRSWGHNRKSVFQRLDFKSSNQQDQLGRRLPSVHGLKSFVPQQLALQVDPGFSCS